MTGIERPPVQWLHVVDVAAAALVSLWTASEGHQSDSFDLITSLCFTNTRMN